MLLLLFHSANLLLSLFSFSGSCCLRFACGSFVWSWWMLHRACLCAVCPAISFLPHIHNLSTKAFHVFFFTSGRDTYSLFVSGTIIVQANILPRVQEKLNSQSSVFDTAWENNFSIGAHHNWARLLRIALFKSFGKTWLVTADIYVSQNNLFRYKFILHF